MFRRRYWPCWHHKRRRSSNIGGSGHAAISQPVSHPVLRSVDPQKVAQFLKERQRYEDEVAEKLKDVPSMMAASYKVSIDRAFLESLQFIGFFENIAPNKTTISSSQKTVKLIRKNCRLKGWRRCQPYCNRRNTSRSESAEENCRPGGTDVAVCYEHIHAPR